MNEARVIRVVVAVVAGAIREAGANGVVLASSLRPETELLERWFSAAAITVKLPDAEVVQGVAKSLEASLGGDASARLARPSQEARRAAARVIGNREGLISISAANKTELIWAERLPPEPLLPLGDLYASQIHALAGACTAPPPLTDLEPERLRVVDEAIAQVVDDGVHPDVAFAKLPAGLRDAAHAAMRRSAWKGPLPPIVPKLGRRTLGVDLEL
ncbi:MAG: hypothetical protein BMS9Abin29_0958 [Gemmatimonadota bacterium]|nr:MAG: hypothetical protein BMS9Abin29_0958 [Gemmatimonadota bacterium]